MILVELLLFLMYRTSLNPPHPYIGTTTVYTQYISQQKFLLDTHCTKTP